MAKSKKRSFKTKKPSTKRRKVGGTHRAFTQRAFGTPLAVTERKYFDSDRTAVAITAVAASWAGTEYDPATLNTLFAPVQGDDYNNRQGRKVHVLGLKIRGQIYKSAQANKVALDNESLGRVVLYMDKQSNATQSQGEEVLASGAGSNAIAMFQNPANFGRFQIIKDHQYHFHSGGVTYDGTNMEAEGNGKHFKWNIKFKKPILVHYNGTNGGTVADVVDNSFHIIANCTDSLTAIAYKCRTTFIDV